jgi:hypothetical protein
VKQADIFSLKKNKFLLKKEPPFRKKAYLCMALEEAKAGG